MRFRTLLRAAGAVAGGFLAAALAGRLRHERTVDDIVAALLADADRTERTVTEDDLADLPDPVRRYLDAAIDEGRPRVRTVRLRQRGGFRLGGASSPWRPLEATQHVTVRPPGFVWDARVDAFPLVPVRVVDSFVGGSGGLRASLLGLVDVADADPGTELDEGELLRYLAESVWFPTALLPGEGVAWEPIDDRSARATVSHRGTTASAVFRFDEEGMVARVSADRPRELPDGSFERTPWTGRFRNYRDRDGLRVPTEADVAWSLPAGDLTYWRAGVTDLEYRPAG